MADRLFDLSGKVAIVTGSGRGLGCAIAEGLAAAVVTCSRPLAEAGQTAARIRTGGPAMAARADTSDRAAPRT